jgi:hypothetical protein
MAARSWISKHAGSLDATAVPVLYGFHSVASLRDAHGSWLSLVFAL